MSLFPAIFRAFFVFRAISVVRNILTRRTFYLISSHLNWIKLSSCKPCGVLQHLSCLLFFSYNKELNRKTCRVRCTLPEVPGVYSRRCFLSLLNLTSPLLSIHLIPLIVVSVSFQNSSAGIYRTMWIPVNIFDRLYLTSTWGVAAIHE